MYALKLTQWLNIPNEIFMDTVELIVHNSWGALEVKQSYATCKLFEFCEFYESV